MVLTKHKNVNSKRLVKEIDDFIVDELQDNEGDWGDFFIRDMSIELFEIVLRDYVNEDQLDHFKCYSDHRNNNTELELQDIYTCTIEFQQSHCFNTTVLSYTLGLGVEYE